MMLSYTELFERGGRTHLSRVQTTQDGERTLFTMQLLREVPTSQQWKARKMQLSGVLFILTTFIPSTRKLVIKIYTYTSPSTEEVHL